MWFCIGLISLSLLSLFPPKIFFVVNIYGSSMLPGFLDGDRVLMIRRFPLMRIRNNWIVVAGLGEKNSKQYFIKRVVAVSNEMITTYLDSLPMHLQFLEAGNYDEQGKRVWIIPPNHVFLQGDNPAQSMDSRIWGPLCSHKIEGIVIFHLKRSDYEPKLTTSNENKRVGTHSIICSQSIPRRENKWKN